MVTEAPIVATGIEHKLRRGLRRAASSPRATAWLPASRPTASSVRYDSGEHQGLQADQVRPLQPGHLHQPAPDRRGRRAREQGATSSPTARPPRRARSRSARTLLVGFMTWEGYNYEDAVLINERLVMEDVYTSIHIEEYRDATPATRSSARRRSPAISPASATMRSSISTSAASSASAQRCAAGDILVGKVTPKGETELTAEERLLRAIFGEKAREVRDTSLKVPHGEAGIIVDVKRLHPRERRRDDSRRQRGRARLHRAEA